MSEPVRIQRKRKKGYNMQQESRKINGLEAMYVGRPTKFGNPFKVGEEGVETRKEAVERYETKLIVYGRLFYPWADDWIKKIVRDLPRLKGKNLACYCSLDEPCHADVLLKILEEENNES